MPQGIRSSSPHLKSTAANCLSIQAHFCVHVGHPPTTTPEQNTWRRLTWEYTHRLCLPMESPANSQQANMLLSMCELAVWAKYWACSAQRYEFLLHSFSLCCIWFSSLHWAPSSPVTLHLHFTICLSEILQITKHLVCCPTRSPYAEKWSEKLGCAYSPVAWPTAAIAQEWFSR